MGSLFLVRHATTQASLAGVNLGRRSDPPLTGDGARLAERTGDAIRAELESLPAGELRLVSSPARRCRETIAIIAERVGAAEVTPELEPGLWEIDYGAWEGLTHQGSHDRDPEHRARWEEDPYAHAAPDGESGADVWRRAAAALEPLEAWLAQERGRAAIVVSHNHVVRLRLAMLLGLPTADYRRRVVADPGAYSLLTFSAGHASLRRANVLPHG